MVGRIGVGYCWLLKARRSRCFAEPKRDTQTAALALDHNTHSFEGLVANRLTGLYWRVERLTVGSPMADTTVVADMPVVADKPVVVGRIAVAGRTVAVGWTAVVGSMAAGCFAEDIGTVGSLVGIVVVDTASDRTIVVAGMANGNSTMQIDLRGSNRAGCECDSDPAQHAGHRRPRRDFAVPHDVRVH